MKHILLQDTGNMQCWKMCLCIVVVLISEGNAGVHKRVVPRQGRAPSGNGIDENFSQPVDSKDILGAKGCHSVPWTDSNCVDGPFLSGQDFAEFIFQDICKRPMGKFPVPHSSSLYVVCSTNSLTINQCRPPSEFLPLREKCSKVTYVNPARKESKGNDDSKNSSSNPLLLSDKQQSSSFVIPIVNDENRLRRNFNPTKSPQTPEIYLGDDNSDSQDLCRQGEGIYPHPFSCHLFVHCASGGQFIKTCPAPTTVFNLDLSICDWPHNVPDCETPESSNSVYSNRELRAFVGLQRFLLNDIGTNSTKRKSRNTSINNLDNCHGEDYIQAHDHCNKFVTCVNGRKQDRLCPPGTLFDAINKVCAHASSVDCQSRPSDFGTFACYKGIKYITPHPDHCNKFVECEEGRLHVKQCEGDLLYNPLISSCDYASNVNCRKPISLENDIIVNAGRREARGLHDYECITGSDYRAPHPDFCNQFVECEEGRLFSKNCGPGTVYNAELGVCDWPYNTRKFRSCGSYEQCISGTYKEVKCRGKSFYDQERKSCIHGYHCPYLQQTEPPITTPWTTEATTTTTETTTTTTTPYYDDENIIIS